MTKFLSGVMATALAVSFALASVVPLEAAPVFVPNSAPAATNVETVQFAPRRRVGRGPVFRPGFYNGHRGYRYRRAGYRYYNGWWFPAGAFIAGAVIGGALAAPRASGNAHVEWCYNRYRSYRASDNTFQPNSGPRRQCNSPFN